jgi:quercetin dioxygenase-like cupin family protein
MGHNIEKLVSPEHEKVNELRPSFKVMRLNDVKVRDTGSDRRLYYFDKTVDIVVVISSKRHIESAHLHTVNTEIYYVVRGKFLFSVEEQDIWLNEGDLVLVNPGVCHHFETTDEEVVFMAIKKVPGLDDKELC